MNIIGLLVVFRIRIGRLKNIVQNTSRRAVGSQVVNAAIELYLMYHCKLVEFIKRDRCLRTDLFDETLQCSHPELKLFHNLGSVVKAEKYLLYL